MQVNFMWQNTALQWLWVLEYDVRLLGHWGRFLNAAMHIAAQAKAEVSSLLHPWFQASCSGSGFHGLGSRLIALICCHGWRWYPGLTGSCEASKTLRVG